MMPKGGSSKKNLGGHGSWGEAEERGLGVKPPENFFDHAIFCPKEIPFLSTETGHLYTKKLRK